MFLVSHNHVFTQSIKSEIKNTVASKRGNCEAAFNITLNPLKYIIQNPFSQQDENQKHPIVSLFTLHHLSSHDLKTALAL